MPLRPVLAEPKRYNKRFEHIGLPRSLLRHDLGLVLGLRPEVRRYLLLKQVESQGGHLEVTRLGLGPSVR